MKHRIKKIFYTISIFMFVCWGCGAATGDATDDTGGEGASATATTLSKLSVSGNLIVNEEGEEVRLRGVNTTDPLWLEKLDFKRNGVADNRFAEIATDFARMKELGANIVRLPLYPGYYFLVGGETYLTTYVDRMVDLAEENGLYAIISYHVIGRRGAGIHLTLTMSCQTIRQSSITRTPIWR